MALKKIFSFLTYPGKNKDSLPKIGGTAVKKSNKKLYKMLQDIYDESETVYNIPVKFRSDNDDQKNSIRDLIMKIANKKSIGDSRKLAENLEKCTTKISGMGLLFVMVGDESNGRKKVVVSRFPADEGIVANRTEEKLDIKFVEEVFLKNSHAYKSSVYIGKLTASSFWEGLVIDKQINHGASDVANYWIIDFLESEFKTTPAQGTKRLAVALREAAKVSKDSTVKHEIVSSIALAKNLPKNKAMSIREYCQKLNLSKEAQSLVCSRVKPQRLIDDKFIFLHSELKNQISYKMVELDNGAMITADALDFDKLIDVKKVSNEKSKFSTVGKIIEEKLKKVK